MSITSFTIEHISDFYDYANKKTVRNLVKENVGRFIKYEETNNFLNENTITGIEKFSKKEQNLFADVLEKNPFKSMIIGHYNHSIEGLEIKDKSSFIKRLRTLSEFLKAYPYNDPGFQFKSYQKIIDWAINNENGNFDLLIKGFNNYVESTILRGLYSDDLVESKQAVEDIKERVIIKEEIEKKNLMSTGIAGILSVGLAGVLGGGGDMAHAVIPKVTSLVGSTAFAPTMIGMAYAGIGAFAFYKTFQILNGVVDKVVAKADKNSIRSMKAESLTVSNVKDFLRNEMFKDILIIPEYDITKKENQKYLDLLLFANDKLSDVGRVIPGEIILKHKLTTNQVRLLNTLDDERIHQITNVKHPQIREWMLLGEIEGNKEFFFRSVSNAMFLMGNKRITTLDNPEIKNIDPELRNLIDGLSDSSKKIVNSYLSVNIKEDGICPKTDMKNVIETLSKYGNDENLLASILTENLQTKIKHFDKLEIKNKELNYFKRIVKFIVGSSDEKLNKKNEEVRNYILMESEKYAYEQTEKVVRKNPGLVEKLSTNSVNVLYKIGEIREKLKESLTRDTTLRPQN